jgi:hypothetical protein
MRERELQIANSGYLGDSSSNQFTKEEACRKGERVC